MDRDYMDLNKACPKDLYPLPDLNRIVDAALGHELLSFKYDFSRYNQIKMYQPNKEKTTLVRDHGVYYYYVMSLKLKKMMG